MPVAVCCSVVYLGVSPAKVVIIGGGVVGSNAAQMAIGMGANVVILDRSIDVLRRFRCTIWSPT
ncbi:MAG: NAD-binding protein [Enterobacterales bacterium]|nr:NAD-binding protein [Enterobacterales bacterium]